MANFDRIIKKLHLYDFFEPEEYENYNMHDIITPYVKAGILDVIRIYDHQISEE